MRFGAPIYADTSTPEKWISAVKAAGYRAAYCPVPPDAPDEKVQAYRQAAQNTDIVIAEVGAWSNPLSPDPDERQAALEKCKAGLDLAERIGARCCVNICGSRGTPWDGPHPDNLTEETFGLVVESVREIVDAVQPRHTFYTLEPMPWMYPDDPDSYLRLIEAVDRPQFGVHLDPVNWINSPQKYFRNAAFMRACFDLLGPYIKSVHAKDIALAPRLTTHLDEVRPGLGGLDYATLLTEMTRLPDDTPFLLEHLPSADEYARAAEYVRGVAAQVGVEL